METLCGEVSRAKLMHRVKHYQNLVRCCSVHAASKVALGGAAAHSATR